MYKRYSDKLGPCPKCKSESKILASLFFGYLDLKCRDCGFSITSETRSGNEEYILEKEMLERWNKGIENARDG